MTGTGCVMAVIEQQKQQHKKKKHREFWFIFLVYFCCFKNVQRLDLIGVNLNFEFYNFYNYFLLN